LAPLEKNRQGAAGCTISRLSTHAMSLHALVGFSFRHPEVPDLEIFPEEICISSLFGKACEAGMVELSL